MKTIIAAALIAGATSASAQQLIMNGGFETGDLSSWTLFDQGLGSGELFVTDLAAGANLPFSAGASSAAGATEGEFYAAVDQNGFGAYSISQDFTVAADAQSVVVSFDLYNGDASFTAPLNSGFLDASGDATQWARVDILDASGAIIATIGDRMTDFQYVSYSEDITALVAGGGTFTFRFAHADNQSFFHSAIDNVSVAQVIPAPATGVLATAGCLFAAGRRRG